MKKILFLLFLIVLSSSFGFVHPRQVKIKTLAEMQKEQMNKRILSSYSVFALSAGNLFYPGFSIQEGFYSLEYGLITKDLFSYKFSLGAGSNKDSAGNIMKTYPLDFDILVGYGIMSRIDTYLGAGAGYTIIQDYINKQGLNYHFIGGLNFSLSQQSSFFIEYKRYFLNIDAVDLNSELLKFGFTFKFYPQANTINGEN
ncbi:MAG: hypothetical protein PHV30_00350 [Candidatus Margulisbacteria bacterium]|nr:hypothetical protein [Candidatus Margulisiibacteriota bacterium]